MENVTSGNTTTLTSVAKVEYGTVADDNSVGVTVSSSEVPVALTSVEASGKSARSTTTLTLSFSTPDSDAVVDKLDYIGVEVPHGWGNVLRGYTGAATVANSSVVDGTVTTGTVNVERDA